MTQITPKKRNPRKNTYVPQVIEVTGKEKSHTSQLSSNPGGGGGGEKRRTHNRNNDADPR